MDPNHGKQKRNDLNLLARATAAVAPSPLLESLSKTPRVALLGGTTSTALSAENVPTPSPRLSSTSSRTRPTASDITISSTDPYATRATVVLKVSTSKQIRVRNSIPGALHASHAASSCETATSRSLDEDIASDMPKPPQPRREATSDLETTDHETSRNVERDS